MSHTIKKPKIPLPEVTYFYLALTFAIIWNFYVFTPKNIIDFLVILLAYELTNSIHYGIVTKDK